MSVIPPVSEVDHDDKTDTTRHIWFPPQAGGIALNLAGLAAWCHALGELHGALLPAVPSLSAVAMVASAVIMGLSLLKVCIAPCQTCRELCDPKACGSHGALLMAVTLGTAHLPQCDAAGIAIHVCFALQAMMLLWYIYLVRGVFPCAVPIWYPPTIGIGAAAIAGSEISSLAWQPLQPASFGVALFLCVLLWPCVTVRLYQSRHTAATPSVAIHAAPFPLVGLAYTSAFREEIAQRGPSSLAFAHILFASSSLAALVTLCAMWVRRSALASFIRSQREGFVHPDWAALTFPLVATSQHAILYASRVVAPYGSQAAFDVASTWATLTAVVCVAVVVPIDALFLLWGVPLWLRNGVPLASGEPSVLEAARPSEEDAHANSSSATFYLRVVPSPPSTVHMLTEGE